MLTKWSLIPFLALKGIPCTPGHSVVCTWDTFDKACSAFSFLTFLFFFFFWKTKLRSPKPQTLNQNRFTSGTFGPKNFFLWNCAKVIIHYFKMYVCPFILHAYYLLQFIIIGVELVEPLNPFCHGHCVHSTHLNYSYNLYLKRVNPCWYFFIIMIRSIIINVFCFIHSLHFHSCS